MKIMVSACLLGQTCKYNGGNNYNETVVGYCRGHEVVPVCPEVMGGLPTPRVPSEIRDGKVVDKNGISRDESFRKGAETALAAARRERPDLIRLQSRSPSCGVNRIYDGAFSGKLTEGSGVFAKLARGAGFKVIDVEDL